MLRCFIVALLAIAPLSVLAAIPANHAIGAMPTNSWLEIKNTPLSKTFPPSPPPGNTGPRSVIDAWSGGAFDSKRNRLIVWGGGHQDYSGNEVYVFDLATLKWQRLTDPSKIVCTPPKAGESKLPCVEEPTGYYPDGLPRARHTYGFVDYLPSIDRFCSFGSGIMYPYGQVGGKNVDCFNFDTLQWTRMADGWGAGLAVQDNATGDIYSHANNNGNFLTQYNAQSNSWKALGNARTATPWFNGTRMNGAIDAVTRKLVTLGGNEVYVWDIDKRDASGFTSPYNVTTTGGNELVSVVGAGLAWDPIAKRITGWHGGQTIYTLDTKTWQWTKQTPTLAPGSNPPTTGNINGTWGRFRYVPDYDVFIGVNRTDENVFIYRPARGTPPIEPKPEPKKADLNAQAQIHAPEKSDEMGTVTVTLQNQGPDDATNVRVSFDLPSFIQQPVQTAALGPCSAAQRQMTCRHDTLKANTSTALTISFTATQSGVAQTYLIASATEEDPDPFDNTAPVTWNVALSEPEPEPPANPPPDPEPDTPPPTGNDDDDATDDTENAGGGAFDLLMLAFGTALIAARRRPA